MNYLEELQKILNEMFMENRQVQCPELKMTDRFKEDLLMDSFDLAELTVRIEDKFGVDIFEQEIVLKVSDAVRLLEGTSFA